MKTIFVFFLLISSFAAKAQNLVVNGDFELYDQCPQLLADFNGYITSVYNPHPEGDCDYYNECSPQIHPCDQQGHVNVPLNAMGYQYANSGVGYVGLAIYMPWFENYRENIVLPLQQTLTKDSIYTISFFVSKADICSKTTDAIMVAFSEDSIAMDHLSYLPLQIDGFKMADSPIHNYTDWILLKKQYIARGTENFMVIGNFLSDNEVIMVESENDPWPCTDMLDPGVNGVYFYIDNVSIEKTQDIRMFPNVITPNNDGLNDRFTNMTIGYEILEAKIYNRWGNLVYENSDNNVNWDGKINEQSCEDGVYFYSALIQNNTTGEMITKQGAVTLIK